MGLGTNNPINVLHVHQTDATANSYVHITHADGGSGGTDGLSIGIEDGGVNAAIRNRENGYLRMFTNNTEQLRIDSGTWSSGNMDLGTVSPDANLHIKGGYPTVHIERDSAINYSRLLLDNTANDGGAIDGIGDGTGGLRFSTSDAGTITERVRNRLLVIWGLEIMIQAHLLHAGIQYMVRWSIGGNNAGAF